MTDGRYLAICQMLEAEYGLDIVNEITPVIAELNDKFESDNIVVALLPSRKGTRIMVLRLGGQK